MKRKSDQQAADFFSGVTPQRREQLNGTRILFVFSLMAGTVFAVAWTIIGFYIPEGAWFIVYNIVMFIISVRVMFFSIWDYLVTRNGDYWTSNIFSAAIFLIINGAIFVGLHLVFGKY